MNIESQYFIHIGPPKTATTSLQEYFINNNLKDVSYEGILQPRDKNDKTLCKRVYRKVNSECDLDYNNFSELMKDDNNSRIIILSEEMFLVESPQLSWKKKIERLKRLTSEIEPTIVIVLRDPVSAIKSYYQELYFQIDRSRIKNINEFAKSSYCDIYRYDELVKFLDEIGFRNIKLLQFKKLINEQYTVDDIFNNLNKERLALPQKNISKKKGNNYYANHSTMKKVILANTPSSIKKLLGDGLKRKISSLIPDLKLYKRMQSNDELKAGIVDDFSESYEKMLTSKLVL